MTALLFLIGLTVTILVLCFVAHLAELMEGSDE